MQGLRFSGSSFFWRLFASYVAVLLVTATIVVLLIDERVSTRGQAAIEQRLREDCVLAATFARPGLERARRGEPVELDEALAEVAERTGLRVTLIETEGRVLADSHEAPERMDNHVGRPEVREALEQGSGADSRLSHTVGYPMFYVANAIRDGEEPLGIVRVAMPLSELEEELSVIRSSVYIGTLVGTVGALLLGLFVARRMTAPIAAVTRVAEDLRDGRYESRVPYVGGGDVGVLADTMNRLAGEVTGRIDRITREDARLRAMLAAMVEGVIAVDDEDSVAFCNEAARQLLDLGASDVVGRPFWGVVRAAGLMELLEGARRELTAKRGELVFGHAPNEQTLVAHAVPFDTGTEGPGGLVIVLHDTTHLQRLERVRRDFVANVSHELKTPLTSIKAFVETLLDGAINEAEVNERFLLRIQDNVERLDHLVSDLLSLARIEAESGSVPRAPVEWAAIVARVVDAYRRAAKTKGLELVVESEKPFAVLGDAEAIEQVVGNLVGNAVHYTNAGAVRVRIFARGDTGVLEVEDTGEGIPREDLDRVFERFYRVDKARSRNAGGTGLGLSIVRNLVLSMGGEVHVRSELGRGSTFTVELALANGEGLTGSGTDAGPSGPV